MLVRFVDGSTLNGTPIPCQPWVGFVHRMPPPSGLEFASRVDASPPVDPASEEEASPGVVLASADKKIAGAVPPDATHLPLDPQRPIAPSALSAAVKNRAGRKPESQVHTG